MSGHTATRLAWSLWALSVALAVATGVLGRLAGTDAYNDLGTLVVAWFAIQSYAMVGAIVASRRPENPIGWIFLAAPALMMTANTAGAYVELAVARSLPGAVPVWLGFGWTWALAIGLIASFLVLLFPEGRLPSPRWRPVLWFVVGWLAAVVVLFTFKPGPLDEPLGHVENPVGIPGFGTLEGVVFGVGGVIVLAASLAALATRLRRGSGEERQQLKWFLAAVAMVLFIIIGVQAIATSLISGFGGIPDYGWLLTIALIPLAVGVAILRYHLYDLGRIVNRTVVYVLLSAALAGLYFGIVLALQQVFSPLTRGSDLAIAGSTLAVAALFRPARGWIQGVVDRRFYRWRYDAARTLEAFSARLRDEVDLEALGVELRSVVQETMHPAHVSLWLRPPFEAVTPAVTISGRSPSTKEPR